MFFFEHMALLYYKMNHLSLLFHKPKPEVDKLQYPSKLNHNNYVKAEYPVCLLPTYRPLSQGELSKILQYFYYRRCKNSYSRNVVYINYTTF